ncbi:hypothetical protein [Microbulbifer sp. ZKSA002]|uniref:hypothetical protein n=1 Tax=Microbulbifer sp. ZKSA002 TaxID=3243388 RepID=UPI004039A518
MLAGNCDNEILCYLDDTMGGNIDIGIDDEILMCSYGELYADAKKNKRKINQDLVARAPVRVLVELHRRDRN